MRVPRRSMPGGWQRPGRSGPEIVPLAPREVRLWSYTRWASAESSPSGRERADALLDRLVTAAGGTMCAGAFGKPRVLGRDDVVIEVSRSSSCGVHLLGLSRAGLLGVDAQCVPCMPQLHDLDDTAPWLTLDEAADLARTPAVQRARRTALWWSRKEAVLKALGSGLLMDPRRVTLSAEATVVHVDCEPDERWWLQSFTVAPDVVATVALRRVSAAESVQLSLRGEASDRSTEPQECCHVGA